MNKAKSGVKNSEEIPNPKLQSNIEEGINKYSGVEAEGYNGYTNYETWLICLNIDNDSELYESINDLTTEYLNEYHYERDITDKYELGKRIKDYLEELFCNDEIGVIHIRDSWTWRDWQEIDWIEVAETRITD